MPWGPFEMQDMAGLDISYLHRQAARARGEIVPETRAICWYRQAAKDRRRVPAGMINGRRKNTYSSPAAQAIIAPLVVGKRELSAETIINRLITAMAEEGNAILQRALPHPQPISIWWKCTVTAFRAVVAGRCS